MWESVWQQEEVHVWPLDDLIAHEVECPCLPVVQPVEDDEGSIGWVFIHNAWDGRE